MKRIIFFINSSRIGRVVSLSGLAVLIVNILMVSTFSGYEFGLPLFIVFMGIGLSMLLGSLTLFTYGILRDRTYRSEAFSQYTRSLITTSVEHLAIVIESMRTETRERLSQLTDDFELTSIQLDKQNILQLFRLTEKLTDNQVTFTRDELILVANEVSTFPPLLIAWVYDRHSCIDVLPLSEKRRLCSYTRQCGYWVLSQSILQAIAVETRSQRDLKALETRAMELAVFSGRVQPKCVRPKSYYLPITGHVLHVVGKALPKIQTGYTLRTHYTALAQRKLGYHVSVVALVGESDSLFARTGEFVDDIPYFGLAGEPRSKWLLDEWLQSNVDQLGDLVAEIRPAVLHAHSDFLNVMVAQTVAEHFDIPVVYESRGFWEESWISRTGQTLGIEDWTAEARHLGLPDAYVLRKQIESKMRLTVDHVVTLAHVMKEHIVSIDGDSQSISIVPNAVSADNFPISTKDLDLVKALAIPEHAPIIGYISSIVEYEGIDTLIKAFHQEAESGLLEAHLLIVGDGAQLPALKKLVDELGVNRVHFTGRVPHESVLAYYSVIDVFVVPRRPVNVCHLVTPLKPFEAFSTGRAVIMSDVGALREIASESKCARLFLAGNSESLAAELVNVVRNPDLREKLGKEAAEWVRQNRSWDKNAAAYDVVYKTLGIAEYSPTTGSLPSISGGFDIDALARWIKERDSTEYMRWFDVNSGVSADDVISNGWLLAGFDRLELSLPIDWEESCASNRSWAFHLHTWEFMDPVVREYAETGRRELLLWCLDRAIDWIQDFVQSDKDGPNSMAWYDMSLGLRSPRLMALISMAVEAGCERAILKDLLDGAMRHRTEHELERSFNPRTNHGYYAAIGQTVLGQGLRPLPWMLQLEQQGNERLRLMASTQFKEDGAHSEHSPDYHRMVLDSFKLGIEQGLIQDEIVIARISKAAGALGWMIKPDGRLVQFGDSPERVMTSLRVPESTDVNTNFLISRGREGSPNAQTLAVFPAAGYAFVRDPQPVSVDDHERPAYLALSAAFHSRAHKHADDLNFVWSDHGQEILVDAGRYGYGELLPPNDPKRLDGYYYGVPERQYVESTIAHNTVAVDGDNHERRTRDPYGSGLRECAQVGDHYELNAEAPHGHWHHQRRLSMSPQKWLIVEDFVQSLNGKPHDFRSWFNLPGELKMVVHDELTVRFDGGLLPMPLWIRGWGDLELIVPVSGQTDPLRGWRSLKDRSLEPTWSMGYSLNGEYENLIVVTFNFGHEPLDTDPRI